MKSALLLFFSLAFIAAPAQQVRKYDLVTLLQKQKLQNFSRHTLEITKDPQQKAIAASGITVIEGINFKEGTIDIDLQGRNIFQQSFLGIAFHLMDSLHYEAVYFRPFNFGSSDTLRQEHTVQYMSMPDNPWYKLRKESPLFYERKVNPMPGAEDWFHATIIISEDTVAVYVNYSKVPCLKIRRLGIQTGDKLALWSDGLPGVFSNLVISNFKLN